MVEENKKPNPKPSEEPIITTTTSSSSSALKKGSNVFRPGAVQVPAILPGGGMVNAPYGPMYTTATMPGGATFEAKYDVTDQEVYDILSGKADGVEPLSSEFRKGLKSILVQANYLSKKDYVPSASFGYADISAMKDLLREANYLGGYSWREALGIITDRIAESGAGGGKTSTYTQYSISNEQDAEIIVDAALSNFLGRGATKSEKATLAKALKKYEQATPTVTTTTRTGGGDTVGTTVSGVSAEGRQQAILGGFSQAQQREMSGVVNTQLGNLFTDLLRNA